MKTSRFLTVFIDYLLMTVGSVIFCMAWTSFLIPNGLASGGLTGLCTIIQYGTGIPVGFTYPLLGITVLGEQELYGAEQKRPSKKKSGNKANRE